MFIAFCIIRDSALNQGTCLRDSMLKSQECADREELCFTTLKVAKFVQRRLWLNGICLWSSGAMTRTEYSEKTLAISTLLLQNLDCAVFIYTVSHFELLSLRLI